MSSTLPNRKEDNCRKDPSFQRAETKGICSAPQKHRFLECSGTQGSNSSGAGGGERTYTELRVEPWFELLEPRFNLEFELSLSYAVASKLLQRSSCLELIQNRKGVEPTASDQKRKIERAQSRRMQRSSTL